MDKVSLVKIVLFLILLTSCSTTKKGKELLAQKGEILKSYEREKDQIFIVKESERIIKYKYFNLKATLFSQWFLEPLYAIDTDLKACFSKNLVEMEKFPKVVDLRK